MPYLRRTQGPGHVCSGRACLPFGGTRSMEKKLPGSVQLKPMTLYGALKKAAWRLRAWGSAVSPC